MLLYGILFQYLYILCGALRPCLPRDYGHGGVVCVCNATYCDNLDISPEDQLRPGHYLHYESKKGDLPLQGCLVPLSGTTGGDTDDTWRWSTGGMRWRGKLEKPEKTRPRTAYFHRYSIFIYHQRHRLRCWNDNINSNITAVKYNVDPTKRFQEILGFGGAITDAVGINIASLSPRTQEALLRQYFAPEGINYSFIRVPIAGTDFSTHNYTYDDGQRDETLSRFNLTNEDLVYKIPLIKKAMALSPRPLKLLTTSWSAPFWMTEPRRNKPGFTRLKESYYQVLAEYFVKFLDAYKAHGLEFWALTPQNEPADGSLVYFGWNSLGWLPTEQRNFVAHHLGPTLHARGYGNIKILIMDDQRILLPIWVQVMMGEEELRRYVSGIAVHWYADWYRFAGPGLLSLTHMLFPNLFILYTEASIIHTSKEPAVKLGSWKNAEKYAQDIIQDINNWATGWIDWNIALNDEGGPNWVNNTVDSPIIVNASANEFYKQPMFYALAHFSKFVPPGSRRVEMTTTSAEGIESVAFITPRNLIVIVLLNRLQEERHVTISVPEGNIDLKMPSHCIQTLLLQHEKAKPSLALFF